MVPSSVSDYALKRLDGCRMGAVHSVFATSFNVDMGALLLHVGRDDAPLSCLGLSLDAGEMDRLLPCVEPGDRAVLHEGTLRLYGRFGVSEIDISAASVRACGIAPITGSVPEGVDSLIYDNLVDLDLLSLSGLPDDARIARALAELSRYSAICAVLTHDGDLAVHRVRIDASRRALSGTVEYLVGRGLGLTPSGDDVLCGYGCGLRFLHAGTQPDAWAFFADAVTNAMPGKTTAVSSAYLQAMTDGFANADYLDLLEAVARGRPERLPELVRRVLSVGHTSGADSLLGFAAAFCCLF